MGVSGWSYLTALEKGNEGTHQGSQPNRLSVRSLINAKRSLLVDGNSSANDRLQSENVAGTVHVDSRMSLEKDSVKLRAGEVSDEEDKERSVGSDIDEDNDGDYESDLEKQKAAEFFTDAPATGNEVELFNQLTLSRPLLRGVAAMGFVKPTRIQASVIPLALAGRDICASAVTGSGKTAAFVLPILEKLVHMQRSSQIRALILTPTRELAAQCVGMLSSLAQFTQVRSLAVVGGSKNIAVQAAELRARPEIVVATPGRLLDHVTNSSGVSLGHIDFLVLDEADRLLDLGFQDEVLEIIRSCPSGRRQTFLFSATMTTKVDDLVKLSLKRPVRVRVSGKEAANQDSVEVAPRLDQEFVRVRSGNEGPNREGMLLALLSRTYKTQTIVFFDTKVQAHRLMILCGLMGINCAEIHGDLTQVQRLTALDDFANGRVDILLATDLAARGLDIDRVETVINFEMPSQIATYVHRIGRTARAGRSGKSCTLIGEARRHLMKELIKDATSKRKALANGLEGSVGPKVIQSRSIPPAVVAHFVAKIGSLETHVEEVLQAEEVARLDRIAEMEVTRAQNLLEHADEIKSRPAREWFAGKERKDRVKKQARATEVSGTGIHRMNRKKRRTREALEMLQNEDDNTSGLRAHEISVSKAVRSHKKQEREKEEKERDRSVLLDSLKPSKRQKARASDTAGDNSLLDSERVVYAKRKELPSCDDNESAPSAYSFRGFDPDRKLGKKLGHKKFKSKSKYKRR